MNFLLQDCLKGVSSLELAFRTKSLRKLCEEEKFALHKLGSSVSKQLKHRLADICAASTINEIIVGNPKIVNSKNSSKMRLGLCENYYILFCANHTNNPKLEDGKVDWNKISRIKILEINCEHEEIK